MSKKLLVANRAEIACRIFQSAKELGLTTVGLVAPGDEQGRHVTYADELIEVPSYLDQEAIIQAAKAAGVHLIHPGYGFLSERAVFARGIEDAGMIFIGPLAETMELMGEKIAAKKFADKHAVPTLPWALVESGQSIEEAAHRIGFPLLLKASAGGGGKGMRRVDRADELKDAAESASAEAQAAFGDGTLFLERMVDRPQHVEVQVFGDGKGGGVHLYERECSLQRRHQKVIEEAPASGLTQKTREGLHQAALKLVEANCYRSAGTVEFLVDAEEKFYFLEMNTRLQVEHPVTEWVTGTDLVRSQLLLALGNKDCMPQPSPPKGHSFEARIYAEDPSQDFLPTPGVVRKLKWPTGPGIRVDSGIEEGQTVSTQFDPMLAKLVTWGVSREHALIRMQQALNETIILGLGTNLSYLAAIARDPNVAKGDVYTRYLETDDFKGYPPKVSELEGNLLSVLTQQRVGFTGAGGGVVGGIVGGGIEGAKQDAASPWFDTTLGGPL